MQPPTAAAAGDSHGKLGIFMAQATLSAKETEFLLLIFGDQQSFGGATTFGWLKCFFFFHLPTKTSAIQPTDVVTTSPSMVGFIPANKPITAVA